MSRSASRLSLIGILTDIRFLQIVGQIIFLILVIVALSGVVNQIFSALAARNLTPNFAFLESRAGFEIAGAGDYAPDDSYWEAFQVGLRNTLTVVLAGLFGATVLGILVGIFLLSGNWLVRTISRVYVEIIRNTPLLVQIFVVYFVVVLALPPPRESFQFPQEGVTLLPLRFGAYIVALVLGARIARRTAANDWRGVMTLPLIVSAIIRIEIGVALGVYRLPGSGALSLDDFTTPYTLAAAVVIALAALAWRAHTALRFALLGVLIGQVLGALLLAVGIVPDAALRLEFAPAFYLNSRGFFYPLLLPTARFAEWALFLALGVVVAVAQYAYFGRMKELTGEERPRTLYALLALVGFAVVGWGVVGAQPQPPLVPVQQDGATAFVPLAEAAGALSLAETLQYSAQPFEASVPRPRGLRFDGGMSLSPGYMALLIALVVYTAAFIAEIVRAGILAVPRGQLEASRALGFSYGQTLSMVILPQALRVIIPPLGNQYLNLSKNSSLAIAIAYPDVYAVMGTVINQSGQAVTGIVVIMTTYLIISLVIAAIMNWVNRRFQIVTR
jgi:general L-amino acid transport system permease protein